MSSWVRAEVNKYRHHRYTIHMCSFIIYYFIGTYSSARKLKLNFFLVFVLRFYFNCRFWAKTNYIFQLRFFFLSFISSIWKWNFLQKTNRAEKLNKMDLWKCGHIKFELMLSGFRFLANRIMANDLAENSEWEMKTEKSDNTFSFGIRECEENSNFRDDEWVWKTNE